MFNVRTLILACVAIPTCAPGPFALPMPCASGIVGPCGIQCSVNLDPSVPWCQPTPVVQMGAALAKGNAVSNVKHIVKPLLATATVTPKATATP
jgi:hypothetical protein